MTALLVLAALAACPEGWTATSASTGAPCYRSTTTRTASLNECITLCGAGAVPACIGSGEENDAVVASGAVASGYHWIGVYQNVTDRFTGKNGARA